MRGFLKSVVFALTFSFVSSVHAYDTDTHFYEMYLLARYAGYTHEAAGQMAAFNQWIDVSVWTSSMFPFPYVGTRMRRLYHFPDEVATYNNANKVATHGRKIAPLQTVDENDPFGRELLVEGMKRGNLVLAFAGLHTHMDSFGHAGYSPITGHAEGGHWPDRPWANVARHRNMTGAIFEDLVALRRLMPAKSLDHEFRDNSWAQDVRPHSELSAFELQQRYNQNKIVQAQVEKDILQDPRYTREAIAEMVEIAIAKGFILEPQLLRLIAANPELYQRGLKAQAILAQAIQEYAYADGVSLEARLDMKYVREKLLPGLPWGKLSVQDMGPEYVLAQAVDKMTENLIPREQTTNGWVAYEIEGSLRQQEMRLRLGDWREVIEKVTGARVKFESRTVWKTVMNFINRLRGRYTPDEWLKTFETITLSKSQRVQWMWSMFRYGFLDAVVKLVRTFNLTESLRWSASPENMLIAHDRAFNAMIEEGTVQQVMTPKQLEKIEKRHLEAKAKMQVEIERLKGRTDLERQSREVVAGSAARQMQISICRDLFLPATPQGLR